MVIRSERFIDKMALLEGSRICIISLLCTVLYVCSVSSTEYVPVFMWESSSKAHVKKNFPALATVSADELKDIVMQKIQDKPVVVIFAEENLSVEDFSWQDEAGEGSFPNLQNISHSASGLTYLPFVHAPLHAFHLRDWYHLKLGPEGFNSDSAAVNETHIFVNLDDAVSSEDRPDLLKRHDAIISQMFKTLADRHGDVLAVYTAHHSSWQSGEETVTRRVRRLLQTADDELFEGEIIAENGTILLYAPNATLYDEAGKSYPLETPTATEDGNTLVLEYATQGITLKFDFEEVSTGYWTLTHVNATVDRAEFLLSPTGIEAPLTFSYHCNQMTITGTEESKLIIEKFQVQPFLEDEKVFGDAYDCVYFFTVPIWSGLFVCTLFSLIMALGLCMIMDIKTMDRFDDPKGKTITINVSE